MTRLVGILSVVLGMGLVGCTMQGPEDLETSADALRGGRACTSSQDCNGNQYCTVEDGDCFSNCARNQPCLAVCWGVCRPDNREDAGEQCGDVTCGAGQVCCNASCGICTEPDGFCTQQLCESTDDSSEDVGERCGDVTCGAGQVCCNASCGICTEPDGFCTQQICESTEI
jgi:hypothetical protein